MPHQSTTDRSRTESNPTSPHVRDDVESFESVNLSEVWNRVARGFPQILGMTLVGLVLGTGLFFAMRPAAEVTTSMRVAFAFNGFEKGQYPDDSKFQLDDLRSPQVINAALARLKLDTSADFQSTIRGAVTVEGIVPPEVVKERDRLRGTGVTPPQYVPDEYSVMLTLPAQFPLDHRQRQLLLDAIASAYRENFERTYTKVPVDFGNAFATLGRTDDWEYELVLNQEMKDIGSYLENIAVRAKGFRSPTTNMGFFDLIKATNLFSQIQLNQVLGLIYTNGLARNRSLALLKIDYYLHTLQDNEKQAQGEEEVVQALLTKTQEHPANYILGIKSQSAQPSPIVDQSLVDSLLANDAYSFLVHQALEAGLKVKNIQAQESRLLEQRKNIQDFVKINIDSQISILTGVQTALSELKASYETLIDNIRKTQADYEKQQFADAIRVTMQPMTESPNRAMVSAALIGSFLGLAAGLGMSLLNLGWQKSR